MSTAGLEVVDSQVHVWEPPSALRPWAVGGEQYAEGVDNLSSAERPPLSPAQLVERMGEAGVARAVLVPPTFAGDDNEVALEGARRWPERFAVMGRIPLDDPAVRDQVTAWRDQPGMLGMRLTFHWGKQRRWLHDGTAEWLWPAAQAAGVPVMVYPPGALDRIADVAARHPQLRVVVDHFALPLEARQRDVPHVVDQLVTLATLPNVAVKASALPSYTDEPYPFRSLHEPIRRVLDAFGPRRVFFGSEVTRLRCTYREVVTLFTEELDFLTGEDLQWVMGRGITEWLGWAPPSPRTADRGRGRAEP